MIDISVILTAFALIFISELPDKSAISSLILGTKFPWRWVFCGVAVAFLLHVLIAVAAGSLMTLLPDRLVDALVAALFLIGAIIIFREGRKHDEDDEVGPMPEEGAGFWKIASLGFGIIFLAEWGDLTQILTANLAARYDNPVSVAIGATLGLCTVGLIAILGGRTLLELIPMKWISRVAAVVMAGLAVYSGAELLT